MTWLIKRTTTETFEVNVAALDPLVPASIAGCSESLDRILGRGGGQQARDAENWIIEQFNMHDGSQYGDKMFYSRADQDTGHELVCEEV